jgi:sugar phosphate isomerase/epimerase
MMQLGIFAKTFVRPDVDACLAAVAAAGMSATQFNLSVLGLPTIPVEPVPDAVLAAVRDAADRHGVTLAAISGTFNAAHPDAAVRGRFIERFPLLCAAATALEIPVITLSSGSRDPDDMWRWHPDNAGQSAWADSRATLRALAAVAQQHGVRLAFEPEHGNVVTTAERAATMLAEVDAPVLGVVYDAANLLDADLDVGAMEQAITSDVATLAPHVLVAHAKELVPGRGDAPAGAGLLPWTTIVAALSSAGFDGPLVAHGLAEADVPQAVATLRRALDAAPSRQ